MGQVAALRRCLRRLGLPGAQRASRQRRDAPAGAGRGGRAGLPAQRVRPLPEGQQVRPARVRGRRRRQPGVRRDDAGDRGRDPGPRLPSPGVLHRRPDRRHARAARQPRARVRRRAGAQPGARRRRARGRAARARPGRPSSSAPCRATYRSTTCAPTPPAVSASPSSTCTSRAAGGSPSSTDRATRCPARPGTRAFERTARSLGLDRDESLRVEAGDFTLAEGRKAAADAARPHRARRRARRQRPARDRHHAGARRAGAADPPRRRRRGHGRHRAGRGRPPRASPASTSAPCSVAGQRRSCCWTASTIPTARCSGSPSSRTWRSAAPRCRSA